MRHSVLIVDADGGARSALSGVLRDEGYTVDAVESGEACLERVTRGSYDAIVLDLWLPGLAGLATLEPRHLSARPRRPGHARAPAGAPRRIAGDHDLRARQHRVGGARDQDGRVRLRPGGAVC